MATVLAAFFLLIVVKGNEHDYHRSILEDFHYQFDTEQHHYLYYDLKRPSDTETIIYLNKGVQGKQCGPEIYRESAKFTDSEPSMVPLTKSVTYKMSLHDLQHYNITCVRVEVTGDNDGEARLFVDDKLDHSEGGALSEWGGTPPDLLQHYPLKNGSALRPDGSSASDWAPNPLLKPETLSLPESHTYRQTHNLYFTFTFVVEVSYHIIIYGIWPTPPPDLELIVVREKWPFRHLDGARGNAATAIGYQAGEILAPNHEKTSYWLALKLAVVYARLVMSASCTAVQGDSLPVAKEKAHFDRFINPHFKYIESTIQRHVENIKAARQRGEDTPDSPITARAEGAANSCYMMESLKKEALLFANATGKSTSYVTLRIYNKYITYTVNITVVVVSKHTAMITNKQQLHTIPRRFILQSWCVYPLVPIVTYKCARDGSYDDDNLPPEYIPLKDS